MRAVLILISILTWQSIVTMCFSQAVDPVHQKYWLMRARFRDQFIVRGVDPLPVCEQKTSVYGPCQQTKLLAPIELQTLKSALK